MTMSTYAVLRAVSIALGVALLTLQTWLLLEHAAHTPGVSQALMWAVPIVTTTLAVLPVLLEHVLHRRAYIKAAGLALLFVALVGYSLPQAIGRSGEARDAKAAEAVASGLPLQLQREALAAKVNALAAVETERRTACVPRGRTRELRLQFCADREARHNRAIRDLSQEADVIRTSIAKLAPAKTGAGDTLRLAALLGLAPETIELYQPLFLPIGIELGVWVLLWIGFAPDRRHAPAPEPVAEVPTVVHLDPVRAAVLRAGRPLTNGELAKALRCSEGQASKLASAAGLTRVRDGRHVRLTA